MSANFGISQGGIDIAMLVKQSYRTGDPICVPGDPARILLPEHLVNIDLDLTEFEDPLPLALMATRDPESPDRKSTRLNSSHITISYAVFCLKKKNKDNEQYKKS